MKRKLLFFLVFITCHWAFAQNKTRLVTGTVTDNLTKETIVGATVILKGTTIGTQTTADGKYKISVPSSAAVLVFRFIGYKTQEVKITDRTQVDVTLESSSQQLNEVVAIGYQTVSRRELTGAVSSVTAKDLKNNPTLSAAEALQGKLAGVQVVVSEGQPGAPVDIYIRGRNSITQSGSPLYIVDGVQLDNALTVLSPQDIESIDVLKDAASTAIYGARGANGVVIITTKGGKNTNGKTLVTYNNSIGFQQLPKELSVMDPYQFVLYQYERAKRTNDTSVISRYVKSTDPWSAVQAYQNVAGIDWQKQSFGGNAYMATHNFSVSGGTKQTQYSISGTLNQQDGLLVLTNYNRQLLNFRFDHQANDKLKVGFNVRFNNNVLNGQFTSDAGGAGGNNLRQVVRYQPVLAPGQTLDTYDVNQANATNGNGLALINPLRLLAAQYRKTTNRVLNINGSITYQPTKHLTIRSVASIDYNFTDARAFDDTVTNNARTNNNQPLITQTTGNIRTINNSNTIDYNLSRILNSKHSIDLLAGEESYQTYTTSQFIDLRQFPVGTTPDQAFANYSLAQVVIQPTSSELPVQNLSFFGRMSYNYNSRYYATFNIRADASSIFGPMHKWGYFPSGSLMWRVSDEAFMKNQTIVSDLKLRVSYGMVGNNRISPFAYDNFYTEGKPYFLNDAFVFGSAPSVLGNPDLQWESQESKNIGIDLALLNGRLQLTVDAYRNLTSNLLLNNQIPYNTGYTTQFQNVGAVQNTGLEIQLNGTIVQSKKFSWTGNFNISFNKNIIKSLGNNDQFTFNSGYFNSGSQQPDFRVKVGEEVGTMIGLVNDGYYTTADFDATPYSNAAYPWANTQYKLKAGVPTSVISTSTVMPGVQKFKDLDGNGVIDNSDVAVIGHALPKFTGGFGQQFTYKNFDLSVFLNFSYGNQIANYNKLEFTSSYTNGANLLSDFNDRWHIVNPATGVQIEGNPSTAIGVIGASPDVLNAVNGNAKYWLPVLGVEWNHSQSYDVENGSYLRLNTVTLGYTFSKSLLSKIKIANLRMFITGSNLGTITGYSGYDPDVSTRRGSPVTSGVDYSAFPKARVFVAGVNLTF